MSGSAGMELLQKKTYIFAQTDDLSATGENLSVEFANPIDIYRFGYISETAVVIDANGLVASLEAEPAGGGTNRVSGATLTMVDADDHIQGVVVFTDVIIPVAETVLNSVGIGGQKKNVDPSGPFRVHGGEQVSVNITNAGTSGTVRWFIEYVEQPFPGQPGTTVSTLSNTSATEALHYYKK